MTLLNETDPKVHIPPVNSEDIEDADVEMTFKLAAPETAVATIKVIGVGGGGCSAAQRMASVGINEVEIIGVNTDLQHLRECKDLNQWVQIGIESTKGLGAGMDPEQGLRAAEESREELDALVRDTDMLFLTAGMGGGTGTGAIPLIAELSRSHNVLTIGVVTRPFAHEMARRNEIAADGIAKLREYVDALIVVPNDRLLDGDENGEDMTVGAAYMEANKVLHNAVRGISDLITRPGEINVDFADVRTVMANRGLAIMGTGSASGDGRAEEATHQAMNNRFLEAVKITNAQGLLINITTNGSLKVGEQRRVSEALRPMCQDEASFVMGTVVDPGLSDDELAVTLVVAGYDSAQGHASTPFPTLKSRKLAKEGRVVPMPAREAELKEEGESDSQVPPVLEDSAESSKPMASEATETEIADQEEVLEQAAVAGLRYPSEGATALKPEQPDWESGKTREIFSIPSYLRKQHD